MNDDDNIVALTALRSRQVKPPRTSDTNLPVIRIEAGELSRMVNEAETALTRADLGLYNHYNRLVRVVRDEILTAGGGRTMVLRISQVQRPLLLEFFAAAARFEKYNPRVEDYVPADCPDKVADAYLARDGSWELPRLLAVVNAPTFRPDGRILEEPGYDPKTGLLFDPQGVVFPKIKERPNRDDALEGLAILGELLEGFSFVTMADKSVAFSAIITTVIRRSISVAPMHAFTAPVAGSGKSMLVDIAARIATGRPAAVTSTGRDQPHGDAELEKRLVSSLLGGDAVLTLDNLEGALGGELLCQILTQPLP